MVVGKICNRDVAVVSRHATVREIVKLMRRRHVDDVVVVERDGLRVPIGIVTDRDIVMKVVAKDIDAEHLRAADIMSKDFVSVNERDGVYETVRKICAKGARRIPVINHERGLVGMVSVDDLLLLLAGEAAPAKTAAREEARPRP